MSSADQQGRSFSYDVFLSYNQADKPRVRRLAQRLRTAGLQVWFDEWNVRPRDVIALKVEVGLEQSRVLLLCISPNALASGWVALERSTAIHRDPANEGRRFIPVLLADCELPDTLRRYKYVDFRDEADAVVEELLTACRSGKTRSPRKRQQMVPAASVRRRYAAAVLERVLDAHSAAVNSLAFSADGALLASGSYDKTVRVWSSASWTRSFNFTGPCGVVTGVSFTPDTQRLVSSTKDSLIYIWHLGAGKLERRLRGHRSFVNGVVVLPDSQRIVSWSGGGENAIMVWDRDSDDSSVLVSRHSSSVRCVAVSADGRRALSGFTNGTLRYFDTTKWTGLGKLEGHSSAINAIQITPDDRFAFTASDDRSTKIWDLEEGRCVGTLEGHTGWVTAIALSPDGSTLISVSSADDTVRLWSWKTGRCLDVQLLRNGCTPVSVVFSPDGAGFAVGANDGSIHLFRLTVLRPPPSIGTPRRYVNAKVVLLGEGTVGKTSLAHRLIEDEYVVRDRTHGMNVWRLELPLPPDAVMEREALLWDLAGQEDYRLIHRLFLEETALALLLINPQKDDPFAEAGDWLKALKSAASRPESPQDAARLLIFSQVDVGGMKLGNVKIERFCSEHGFTHWLPTSAKTGENCSDKVNGGQPSKLKQLIAGSIQWDKLPWTSTPRLLSELKNAVVAMRDKADIRLLRFAELTQRLEQALPAERFGESDVRTAVTLLANHGLARPLKFGDLVLLRPELLNGYAGAIIRAARAHTDEIGCVLEADIYHPGFDFTGVERLKHRSDEELLLRALVQTFLDHSLCIAEETPQGRHLVFPSQYRREKDIPRDPDIFVSYTFGGEWQTVWTTLVVRLWFSLEFKHRELWRNAAEFASPKDYALGLKIDNKQGEGVATISLYFDKGVPDELKAIFIEYVHRHLAKYGCEVSRDRRYVCSKCGKSVKDHDEVRDRLAAGKMFIYCQRCDAKVPLFDFIERRLKSDPVALKILAMDATATRELDAQALEQILIGHMLAICGEANQIFRPTALFDYGIDGEVEFKDDDGKASGRKIYVQLKRGDSHLRFRKTDGKEILDVKSKRHLEYWVSQPGDVYLVVQKIAEVSGGSGIRWMNLTRYLKTRQDKTSRQIVFDGEKLDMEAVWKVRDEFFPPQQVKEGKR